MPIIGRENQRKMQVLLRSVYSNPKWSCWKPGNSVKSCSYGEVILHNSGSFAKMVLHSWDLVHLVFELFGIKVQWWMTISNLEACRQYVPFGYRFMQASLDVGFHQRNWRTYMAAVFFSQTVCPHWGFLTVGVKAGVRSGCSIWVARFDCAGSHKSSPCEMSMCIFDCAGSHKVSVPFCSSPNVYF